MASIKVLFIPVSGPEGIGEYMRSLILADAVSAVYSEVEVSFILSKGAPYVDACPYPVHLTDESPTKCTVQVNAILQCVRPTIAIFDCSGRASQYKKAKELDCKVIFISQHKKKRRRAFALNRIGNVDAHCITQFKFVDGDVTWFERIKLALARKPAPYFMGPVFSVPSTSLPFSVAERYVVFSAGGGGHAVNGVKATDVFILAATRWFEQTGEQCHVLLGPNYQGEVLLKAGVVFHRQLPNADLMALMKGSRVAVLGGGDMLSQAVALKIPSIAVAVAKDQPPRIKAIVKAGLTTESALDVEAIVEQLNSAVVIPSQDVPVGREVFLTVLDGLLAAR